jgi:hypothetical protein
MLVLTLQCWVAWRHQAGPRACGELSHGSVVPAGAVRAALLDYILTFIALSLASQPSVHSRVCERRCCLQGYAWSFSLFSAGAFAGDWHVLR